MCWEWASNVCATVFRTYILGLCKANRNLTCYDAQAGAPHKNPPVWSNIVLTTKRWADFASTTPLTVVSGSPHSNIYYIGEGLFPENPKWRNRKQQSSQTKMLCATGSRKKCFPRNIYETSSRAKANLWKIVLSNTRSCVAPFHHVVGQSHRYVDSLAGICICLHWFSTYRHKYLKLRKGFVVCSVEVFFFEANVFKIWRVLWTP